MRRVIAAITALTLLVPATVPAATGDDLPDIGGPANSVLSRETELQIGRSIFRSLVDTNRVMSDPEVQEYVQDVGLKLAAQAQDGEYQFTFFVVNDPAINAFALPGGYIGIHSGLLLASASESELAGVLAHEISHVTQRHISRAVFANQRNSILTMAAMLGAILLGAVGGSGDAITGAIATAQSVAAQQQINFTRANEYEADRVGVGVLAAAGFDPMGMPAFFETLARQTGPLASQAPEFLRTHPVTVNRIAETRERAASSSATRRTGRRRLLAHPRADSRSVESHAGEGTGVLSGRAAKPEERRRPRHRVRLCTGPHGTWPVRQGTGPVQQPAGRAIPASFPFTRALPGRSSLSATGTPPLPATRRPWACFPATCR